MFFKSKPQVNGFVGVTLSPEKISVARIISQEEQKPRLELLETTHLESGQSATQALAALVKKHRLTNAPCSLVLEPGIYNLSQIETPNVEAAELQEAVRWKIKDLVAFDVDDAVIDIFNLPTEGLPNRSKFIYVAAAYAPRIDLLADEIKASGLALTTIDISEMALRNICALFPADSSGAALLYIGENQSLINLTQKATVYLTRNLPLSQSQVQQIYSGKSDSSEDLEDDSGLLERLILEIQRLLGYYESFFSQPPIGTLLVNPTIPELPGFINYTNSHLGISVQVLDLNEVLETDTPLTPAQQSDGLLAIGAALRHAVGGK